MHAHIRAEEARYRRSQVPHDHDDAAVAMATVMKSSGGREGESLAGWHEAQRNSMNGACARARRRPGIIGELCLD